MDFEIRTKNGTAKVSVKRKKIKSIRLRVNSECAVEVSAPHYVRDSVIRSFVQDNVDFIDTKLNETEYRRACSYPPYYKDGDMFTLLGRRTMLNVEKSGRNSGKLNGSVLTLKVSDVQDLEAVKHAFAGFMKRYAKNVFEERLEVLLPQFEKLRSKDIRISVRDMKTRWGSINVKKDTMSLSVHLLRCEMELVDHIILHELCHYAHANHSRAFYAELSRYSPDYRKMQKRLKEYGMVGF